MNLSVNGHASTLIVRPNILKIDGTAFDFGVNTRWDTPSTRQHEHRFSGVVKHSIDGAHGVGSFGGGGTDFAAFIGPTTGFETSSLSYWGLSNGRARSATNHLFETDDSALFLNTPQASGFGKLYFYALNSVLMATWDPVALKATIPMAIVSSKFTATTPQAIALVNGVNNNLAVTSSKLRITGPTAAFSVSGFAQPLDGASNVLDGSELLIYNMTAFALTITNLATSTAANQIDTLTGADVVLPARKSYARFTYDGVTTKWLLTDHS